jgi:hypothetical protein
MLLFAATPASDCELHIWPARASAATTAGALSNFGPIGAYADHDANRDSNLRGQVALIEALTPSLQAQAIAAADLPKLLGLNGATLHFQSANLDPRRAPKSRERLSASTAACYVELVISVNHIRNSAVRGSSLLTSFAFRDFRSGRARIVSGDESSTVKHFPPRTREDQAEAAKGLAEAFATNVRGFAGKTGRRSAQK